jgi:hypothetical protein
MRRELNFWMYEALGVSVVVVGLLGFACGRWMGLSIYPALAVGWAAAMFVLSFWLVTGAIQEGTTDSEHARRDAVTAPGAAGSLSPI